MRNEDAKPRRETNARGRGGPARLVLGEAHRHQVVHHLRCEAGVGAPLKAREGPRRSAREGAPRSSREGAPRSAQEAGPRSIECSSRTSAGGQCRRAGASAAAGAARSQRRAPVGPASGQPARRAPPEGSGGQRWRIGRRRKRRLPQRQQQGACSAMHLIALTRLHPPQLLPGTMIIISLLTLVSRISTSNTTIEQ